MPFDIIWFINCALQIFAAVMAIKLTKLTKMNVAWILICIGLVVMSFRSLIQIVNVFEPDFGFDTHEPYTIGSIVVSLCLATGVALIRKMFALINVNEAKQRDYEKKLLNTTIQAEENERRRFATELHDGLGPLLSTIKMGFSAVADDISDTEVRKNLETAINEAITTVREVSNNMSPHILTNFGLRRAIINFVGKMALPKDMNISYHIAIEDKRYPETIEIVMYRVFCELINNTIKHAGATAINFRLEEKKDWLILTYKDNGTGFNSSFQDDDAEDDKRGMGLYNIISRVSSLKGKYQFKTGSEEFSDLHPSKEHGMAAEISIPTVEK